jgi:hypothetical protein
LATRDIMEFSSQGKPVSEKMLFSPKGTIRT